MVFKMVSGDQSSRGLNELKVVYLFVFWTLTRE